MYTSLLRRKAIVRPSGDHANQRMFSAWRVSRRSPLPSAFTTKRSEFPDRSELPSYLLKAIRRPFGDHAGSPEVALAATRRALLPSAFMTNSPSLVGFRASAKLCATCTTAIRCPSGDHAPASGTFLGARCGRCRRHSRASARTGSSSRPPTSLVEHMRPACRQSPQPAPVGIHDVEGRLGGGRARRVASAPRALLLDKRNRPPIRRPGRIEIVRRRPGQVAQPAAVGVHHVDLGVAVASADERDFRPSGDQLGWLSLAGCRVRFSCALPSAFIT